MKYIQKLSLFTILLGSAFFIRVPQGYAQDMPRIILSEIKIGEIGAVNNEFIELYNPSDQTVDISDWKLQKKTSTGSASSIASIDKCVFLPPKKHFLWANTNGRFLSDADKTTVSSLAIKNTFEILDPSGVIEDFFIWDGSAHDTESAQRNPETLAWNFTPSISPTGHEYICKETLTPTPVPKIEVPPATNIPALETEVTTLRINEVLPDPEEGEEFIELFNFGGTDINLKNWSLHDASKTGKYTFKNDTFIKAQSYLTILRSAFSFALNNDAEVITLSDISNNPVNTVNYTKSHKGISYNFSPNGWHWSDIVTPDAPNQFNAAPLSKTILPKHVYLDTPAHFEARSTTSTEDIKYSWDFGDGHKSRLASATHTYEKTGTVTITLTASNAIEDVIETFTLEVEKLPKIKMVITSISPNPTGADTGHEWITIKNQSKKKVNLLDWSIATGTEKKKLTNHPIRESHILKPGKTITIANDICAFSLPNKSGFLELRQTNKKPVDTLRYAKPDGIEENEIYQKSSQKAWTWTQDSDMVTSTDASDIKQEDAVDTNTRAQIIKPQDAPSTSGSALINTIDTLSIEELSLLQTRIEEKLRLATLAKTTPLAKNTIAEKDLEIYQSDTLLKRLNQLIHSFLRKF